MANLNTRKNVDIALLKARDPVHDATELNGIVPVDLKKQYDVREVIARVVDASEFDEFKALYGTTLVAGFAHLHGMNRRAIIDALRVGVREQLRD